MRVCRTCQIEKSISDFPTKKGKPLLDCRICHNAHYRALYANNPKRRANIIAAVNRRKHETRGRQYGLSPDKYDEIRSRELCELCNVRKATCIDHDHVTGRVRGHLCISCNQALGVLGDTTDSLKRVVKYLEGN